MQRCGGFVNPWWLLCIDPPRPWLPRSNLGWICLFTEERVVFKMLTFTFLYFLTPWVNGTFAFHQMWCLLVAFNQCVLYYLCFMAMEWGRFVPDIDFNCLRCQIHRVTLDMLRSLFSRKAPAKNCFREFLSVLKTLGVATHGDVCTHTHRLHTAYKLLHRSFTQSVPSFTVDCFELGKDPLLNRWIELSKAQDIALLYN